MGHLPRPPTAIIGRDHEIVRIVDHLARGTRLVTLTGLGGVGKTRLALAVGARLAARGADVTYVDVSPLHSEAELVVALADALALDLRDVAGARLVSALFRALSRLPRMTVIVDNVEHLAVHGADVLIGCLAAAPDLSLVLTSRVALARPEELAIPIAPLSAAGPDAPAVELLVARAASSPSWVGDRATLARLAARLDGLPLALELAAARASVVAPGDILRVLDEESSLVLRGQHPRRASREAAVAWSWEQLEPPHRAVLVRLALPEGDLDFELAVAIAGLPRPETLDALESLARHALISAVDVDVAVRYRVLETVRDFVATRTTEDERARGWSAIALALLARVEPHVSPFSRELPADVAAHVRRDRDLHMAVLRRGLTATTTDALACALRVAAYLVPLASRSGSGSLAAEWTATILERPEVESLPLGVRLGAAVVLVVARAASDDGVVARTTARIDAWVDATSESQLATSALGIVHYYRWEHRALLTLAEALRASHATRKSPDLDGYVTAAWATSRRALGLSEPEADDRALASTLERLPTPEHVTSACLVWLARASLAIQHRMQSAPELVDRGLALARGAGFVWFEALFVLERGRLAWDRDHLEEAERDLAAALERFDPRAAVRERQETTLDLAAIALERGRHDEARAHLAAAAARSETPFERAWSLAIASAIDALEGRPVGARSPAHTTATIEDAAVALLASIGRAPTPRPAASALARSFRVRRADALAAAAHGLASAEPGPWLAVSLDGRAFRVGGEWIDLEPKPLLRALLSALVEARHAGPGGLDHERLGALLWPDERLVERSRDQRLHTAVSALRREGLGPHLESHEGRYRITPGTTVLRVAPEAWPGHGMKKSRGRGRPRREA
ncbi:MAG: AAA family ATPase [Deltaproteobacteria bacterium]|nr:AAA family ATPase [Deltaproteobacteria bacterium]